MPRMFTVAQLVDRGKKRADEENSDRISDAEWKQNLSMVYAELYTLIVNSGMRYYESEQVISANGGALYAVPADHFVTLAVDGEVTPGGQRYELLETMVQERNAYTAAGSARGRATTFSLVGTNIRLQPSPSTGSYYHSYVPQPQDLTSAADNLQIDVVIPDGEAFITWGLSMLSKAKEEQPTGLDRSEREAARARVAKWAQDRSFINPRRSVEGASADDVQEFPYWY